VQTRVSVDREDNGKSIRLGVGDVLEVSLPETSAQAVWQVEVDTNVLAVVSSPTNTQTVWVLDEVDHMHMRTFRAAKVGHAVLKMSYNSVASGAALATFTLEVTIGDAPKPKAIRQPMPAPQLVIALFQSLLIALAGGFLGVRLTMLVVAAISAEDRLKIGSLDLLIALLGTVAMATIAGFLLLRIIALFAGRMR